MFLKTDFSKGQRQSKLSNAVARLTNRTRAQPLTDKQALQVAGGCSNPQGCASRNEGIAVVTLRQPVFSDGQDHQGARRLPLDFSL